MVIKVLYHPKNFYTSLKQISGYAPLAKHICQIQSIPQQMFFLDLARVQPIRKR